MRFCCEVTQYRDGKKPHLLRETVDESIYYFVYVFGRQVPCLHESTCHLRAVSEAVWISTTCLSSHMLTRSFIPCYPWSTYYYSSLPSFSEI